MKLEKLEARLEILKNDPGNIDEIDRILRMLGDELPRYRLDVLGKARAALGRTASELNDRKDDIHARVTAFQFIAACTLISTYEVAAAKYHCAACKTPLIVYYVLTIVSSGRPPAYLCPTCIESTLHAIFPPAANVFNAARDLKKEVEGEDGTFELQIGDSENKQSDSPTLHVRRGSYLRTI